MESMKEEKSQSSLYIYMERSRRGRTGASMNGIRRDGMRNECSLQNETGQVHSQQVTSQPGLEMTKRGGQSTPAAGHASAFEENCWRMRSR